MGKKRHLLNPLLKVIDSDIIIREYRSYVLSMLFLSLFSFLLLLIPLTFLSDKYFYIFLSCSIFAIWLISFISGMLFLYNSLILNNKLVLYEFSFIFSGTVFLGIMIVVSSIMQDGTPFIPQFMTLTTLILFFLFTLCDSVFKYNNYIARSLAFVISSNRLIILCSVVLLINNYRDYNILLNESDINLLPIIVLQFFIFVIIIRYLYNSSYLNLSDPHSLFSQNILLILCSVLALEITYIYYRGTLEMVWISVVSLIICVTYIAKNPTQRNSSSIILIGFIVFIFLFLSNNFNLFSFSSQVINYFLEITPIVIAIYSLYRNHEKYKQSYKINNMYIENACDEILKIDGFSIDSISKITSICVLTGKYKVGKIMINRFNKNQEDLFKYAFIYLVCSEFHQNGNIQLSFYNKKFEIDEEYNNINNYDDFIKYINLIFPTKCTNMNIWKAYYRNKIIIHYAGQDKIKSIRPFSITSYITKIISNLLVVLLILSFLSNDFPQEQYNSFVRKQKNPISILNDFINKKIIDLRLKFIDSFKPMEDKEKCIHFSYLLSETVWKYKNMEGYYKNNIFYSYKHTLEKLIKYYKLIYEKYPNKNTFYYENIVLLGNSYFLTEKYEEAKEFFAIAYDNYSKIISKDILILNYSECLIKLKQKKVALEILEKNQEIETLKHSFLLLLRLYRCDMMYENIINRTTSIDNDILIDEINIERSVAYYHLGDHKQSKYLLNSIIENNNYDINDQYKSILFIYHGLHKQSELDYYDGSEYIFKGLSYYMLNNQNFLINKENNNILNIYKNSIDNVHKQNPKNPFINLWYFLYYHLIDKKDIAQQYLDNHLAKSPNYEREFVYKLLEK